MSDYLYGKSNVKSGKTLSIIKILRDYNQRIPQDFIAHLMGWSKADAVTQLKSLEEAGLVRFDGDDVELLTQD